jgi:hypothetical protein
MSLFGMPYHYYADKDLLIHLNALVCCAYPTWSVCPRDFERLG